MVAGLILFAVSLHNIETLVPAPKELRAAVQAALPLLRKGAVGHVEQKACFACHNQATPMLAFSVAKTRGFELADDLFQSQAKHIATFLELNRDKFKDGRGTGGQADTAGYALFTLELAGHKPDENTAAVVQYLLSYQADRDHWKATSNRPPSEASDFTTTYVALRGLRYWGPLANTDKEQIAKRVETVHGWLKKTPAKDTEDRVFRLLALKEANADTKEIAAAAWELQRTQRADGGWSQLEPGFSDTYATGTALVALHQAGGLPTSAPTYRAGLAYLLKAQRTDGSWFVKSRSKPFQAYYESGFPHQKDQFIAITASGWATAALALAIEKK